MSAHAHCASPQRIPHRHTSLKPGAREHAQPVSPTHAGSHSHSRRIDTHSETSHATHSHSPAHTLLRGVSRRSHSIISSIIPARARPRGAPKLASPPRRAPRHPRVREFGRRWVPGASRVPPHLAAGAAARGAHSTARLLWRRSPRNRRHRHGRCVLRGDTPGAGRPAAAHNRWGRDSRGLPDQANGGARACRSPGGLGGAACAGAEVLTAVGARHARCWDSAGPCGA